MDGVPPDRMVCFHLHAAARAATHLYKPHLDAAGLTYPQYLVLCAVHDHRTVTVKDLGRTLDLDSGTLSPLLKRLDARGLVHRTRGTHDERTVTVTLTTDGAALHHRLADLPHRLAATVGLDADDIATLHRLLGRIRAADPH